MKLINNSLLYAILISLLSSGFLYSKVEPTENPLNETSKQYFLEVFNHEQNIFNICLKKESLTGPDQVNTKCKISEDFQDASFILNGKSLSKLDFIDKYESFKKIKTSYPFYPGNMLGSGQTGYVVIEFDITKKGKTVNPKVIEGWCGNVLSPFTEFSPCSFFNREAIAALLRSKYMPAKFDGEAIYSKGAKHRFTFKLDSNQSSLSNQNNDMDKAYSGFGSDMAGFGSRGFHEKVKKEITAKNYDSAIEISKENIKYNNIFLYEIAKANYFKGDYSQASSFIFQFIEESTKNRDPYSEEILLSSLFILIESLYFINDFKKIISLEKSISRYNTSLNYRKSFAMTSLYLGTSYINSGDMHKGIYHLSIAQKYAASKDQVEYINNVIDQVANYL